MPHHYRSGVRTDPSPTDRNQSLATRLEALTDDELTAVLTRRPDTVGQLPADFPTLAGRLLQPASLSLACQDRDALTLAVIEILATDGPPTSVDRVCAALADRATAAQVVERLDALRAAAVIWAVDGELQVPARLAEALPWRTPQLTGEQPTVEQVRAAVAAAPEEQRRLLDRLAAGPALGRSGAAGPQAPADHPIVRLIDTGLLRRVDEQTVELPVLVRAVLRGDPPPPQGRLAPPEATGTVVPDADGGGATAAQDLLRQADAVLAVLGEAPAARLRAGGIGIRELRRVAKAAAVTEQRTGLLIELLAGAGLLAEGYPPGEEAPVFAPTVTVDTWQRSEPRERWADLAATWVRLRRRPEAIGQRTDDGVLGPLHPGGRSVTAPPDRETVLTALAAADPGVAPDRDRLLAGVWFAHPGRQRRLTAAAVDEIVLAAQELGLVTAGALTTAGRALLATGDPRAAMSAALPAPVTEFLLQGDLTVTVPGPPEPEFGAALAQVADIESAGGAAVYRVSEASVRRALDAGRGPAEIHGFFAAHAATPVPQSLTYLIDDVARRHGRLRAGAAASFLRSEDPALIASVLAAPAATALGLQGLAPTVAVSTVPLAELTLVLREAGFAVLAQDDTGAVLDLRPAAVRLPATRPAPSGAVVDELRLRTEIASLRRRVAAAAGHRQSADVLPRLTAAAAAEQWVWIESVDGAGGADRARVRPVELRPGRVLAECEDGVVRRFPLHRIVAVRADPE
jgi:hypothetical protein